MVVTHGPVIETVGRPSVVLSAGLHVVGLGVVVTEAQIEVHDAVAAVDGLAVIHILSGFGDVLSIEEIGTAFAEVVGDGVFVTVVVE